MSDGRQVQSVAPVEQRRPGRAVYRTRCEKHNLEYGREMVPSTQEHESYMVGNCPKCEEEVRVRLEWQEKIASEEKSAELEAEQLCATEENREQRVRELADAMKNEDRAQRAEEFFAREDEYFASGDANYMAFADSADKKRIMLEIIEKRRIAFFEQRRSVKQQADAELEKTLTDDRERAGRAALASWIPM